MPLVTAQVRTMIQLQLFTGMRPCEVTIIRGCEIEKTSSVWIYRPGSHKTQHHGFGRTIYLGPKAQQLMAAFIKSDPLAYLFSPRDAVKMLNQNRRACRKTPMTPSQSKRHPKKCPQRQPGEHYTTESYGRAIKRACSKIGIAAWSPNRIRHSVATQLRQKYGIEAARIILGHRSATMTEVYAEVDHTKAIEIISEVE